MDEAERNRRTTDSVARATADVILALQEALPEAQLVPCEAIEGEDIHLEVRLAGDADQLYAAQERAVAIKEEVEDRFGLFLLVRVVPMQEAA